jgi:hypothetical protein
VDAGVQTEDRDGAEFSQQMERRISERVEQRILERHGKFLQTVLAGLTFAGASDERRRRSVCGDCGRVLELTSRAKKTLERLRREFGVVGEEVITCKMTERGNCEHGSCEEALDLGRGVVVKVVEEGMKEAEEKSLSDISRKLEECDAAWLLGERRLSVVLTEGDFVIDGAYVVRSTNKKKKKIHL